jgi:hypothetical protein
VPLALLLFALAPLLVSLGLLLLMLFVLARAGLVNEAAAGSVTDGMNTSLLCELCGKGSKA